MLEAGIPPIGVDIYTPDFIGIARGFGCNTASPASWQEFETALHETHNGKGPTLILLNEAEVINWEIPDRL
jgi:thiamine pyrophosphate-dependent acetolactate synthase large subunit-like protein